MPCSILHSQNLVWGAPRNPSAKREETLGHICSPPAPPRSVQAANIHHPVDNPARESGPHVQSYGRNKWLWFGKKSQVGITIVLHKHGHQQHTVLSATECCFSASGLLEWKHSHDLQKKTQQKGGVGENTKQML